MEQTIGWKNGARCAVMLSFDVDGETLWMARDPKMEPWELVIALQKKRRASGSWIALEPGSGGRSLSPRNRAGPGLGLAPWPHHREAAGSP